MYGKFLVEGHKQVSELLAGSFKTDAVYAVNGYVCNNLPEGVELIIVSTDELKKISTLENPDSVIAVAQIPEYTLQYPLTPSLYLVCDTLNDPGNAGSLIRIADWFGTDKIFFSQNSVDVYNPKVVSAAKGSLFRVQVHYVDVAMLFAQNIQLPVVGTFMDGHSMYEETLPSNGFILLGNEANGISSELIPLVQNKIAIPSYGEAESLNVAVAAGIVLAEFRRRSSSDLTDRSKN